MSRDNNRAPPFFIGLAVGITIGATCAMVHARSRSSASGSTITREGEQPTMATKPVPVECTVGNDAAPCGAELSAQHINSQVTFVHGTDANDQKIASISTPVGWPVDVATGLKVEIYDKNLPAGRRGRTPAPSHTRTIVPLELGEQGVTGYEAEDILRDARLRRGNVKLESSDLPFNTVLRTKPAIGTEVDEGSAVTVYVSDGGRNKRNSFLAGLFNQ